MPYEATLDPQSCRVAGCGVHCMGCAARQHCLSCGLREAELQRWNALMQTQLTLPAGKALFEAGTPVQALYSVRAGCIKTFTLDAEGQERVQGFHLPGDLIGLEAFGENCFGMHAVALVPSQVCVLPRARLIELAGQASGIMQRLVERLSHSLRDALALAGDYSADQRVAGFLLEMHGRLSPLPGKPMRLPMSRRDIANYLRLATETVCRVLARFEQHGLLHVEERRIDILDPLGLRQLQPGHG